MTSLDKLNLRPGEKRLVVVIAIVVFFVLNLWVIVPRFSDWGRVQFRMDKARRTLATFDNEVRQIPKLQQQVRQLGSENSSVPFEQQTLHFANTRESVASQAGVTIFSASRVNSRTNQFFVELNQNITLLCKEEQLVDFLYNLGAGNTLIRVLDLGLRTDAPRQQLNASIKLAASYQKKQPARPATAPGAVSGARAASQPKVGGDPTRTSATPPPTSKRS